MKIKVVYLALALVLSFSLVVTIVPSGTAKAATLCVNPGGTGGCYASIQAAIDAANPAGGDTIIIAAGTYNEHDITINKSLTIQGAGAGSTFVDGQDLSRVFYINNSVVDMSGMTIRNGKTTQDGSGIHNYQGNVTLTNCTISDNQADLGGGIYNDGGNVTLSNCTVSSNDVYFDGGGIYNSGGTVTLTDCTVSDNHADEDGGGIYNEGSLNMTDCTISGNDADGWGGGIFNVEYDDVTMTNCTISGNDSDNAGGGIYNLGILNMTNCTISGNDANDGGGIYHQQGTATLTNCTVTKNNAVIEGGGIHNDPGELTLTCTIVYGNTAPSGPNIYGPYNATECIIDSPNPLLGPLQNNGGPTETHALLYSSPAIDACITSCTIDTDQRGLSRPVDGDHDTTAYCDIGAYEKQPVGVGGIVKPVDRTGILAPWLALAAFMIATIAVLFVMKRRRVA